MLFRRNYFYCNIFSSNIKLSFFRKCNEQNSKKIFLLGDFNVDLLQYETSELANNFADTLSSNFLSPLILLPTRISNSSSPLIDNIFCNVTFNSNILSSNFKSTVSGHFPQFAIIEDFLQIHQNLNEIYFKEIGKILTKICLFQILRMPTGMNSFILTKKM